MRTGVVVEDHHHKEILRLYHRTLSDEHYRIVNFELLNILNVLKAVRAA